MISRLRIIRVARDSIKRQLPTTRTGLTNAFDSVYATVPTKRTRIVSKAMLMPAPRQRVNELVPRPAGRTGILLPRGWDDLEFVFPLAQIVVHMEPRIPIIIKNSIFL